MNRLSVGTFQLYYSSNAYARFEYFGKPRKIIPIISGGKGEGERGIEGGRDGGR